MHATLTSEEMEMVEHLALEALWIVGNFFTLSNEHVAQVLYLPDKDGDILMVSRRTDESPQPSIVF